MAPSKRTCPFSRKTDRSQSSAAMLRLCSTTTSVTPVACIRRTTSKSSTDHDRSEAQRQLVDAEHLGVEQERLGHRDLLLLTAREGARLLASTHGQRREGVIDDTAPFFQADLSIRAVRACISRFSSTVMS